MLVDLVDLQLYRAVFKKRLVLLSSLINVKIFTALCYAVYYNNDITALCQAMCSSASQLKFNHCVVIYLKVYFAQ